MGETQASIGLWIDQTFPGGDPESPRKAIRMLEEAVDLCLAAGASPVAVDAAVNKSLSGSGARCHQIEGWPLDGKRGHLDKIMAEAADVLIVLYGLAHLCGFDLHAAVDLKMAINRQRKWKANGDGTGYHVPSGTEAGK